MKALILSLTLLAATSMSAQDAVQRSFHPNGEVSEVRYPSGVTASCSFGTLRTGK